MLLFLLLLRQLLPLVAMGCSALKLPPRLRLPPECAALIAAAPAGVSASMLARFEILVEQRDGGLMPALGEPACAAAGAAGLCTRLWNSCPKSCSRLALRTCWSTPLLAKYSGTAGLWGDEGRSHAERARPVLLSRASQGKYVIPT